MNRIHDNNGWLIAGLDRHFGVHWPTPIPSPMWFWELTCMHPFILGPNQQPTVKLNGGHNAVVDQHTSYLLWLHFPVIPDPLNILFPLDLLLGNHKTWLARGKVHICGTPAAITLFPAIVSINLDCWTGGNLPPTLVLQPGTVVTTADLGDYFRAAVRVAIEIVLVIIGSKMAVKGRYPNGTLPAAPAQYGWRNAAKNFAYMFRNGAAGDRARSTFRNTLGRELVTRTLPFKVNRTNPKNVFLEMEDAKGIGKWALDKADLDWKSLARKAPGATAPGGLGSTASDLVPDPWKAAKNVFPPLNAVEGLMQGL